MGGVFMKFISKRKLKKELAELVDKYDELENESEMLASKAATKEYFEMMYKSKVEEYRQAQEEIANLHHANNRLKSRLAGLDQSVYTYKQTYSAIDLQSRHYIPTEAEVKKLFAGKIATAVEEFMEITSERSIEFDTLTYTGKLYLPQTSKQEAAPKINRVTEDPNVEEPKTKKRAGGKKQCL
jgi:K+-transporting ATPase c subunit